MIELQRTATATARLSLLASIPLLGVLLLAGEHIVALVFGAQFAPALVPMLILSAGQVLNAASGMGRSMLMAWGNESGVARSAAVALGVNIVSCLLLIPAYGAVGAAVANVVALTVWNAMLWLICWRQHGVDTSFIGWSTNANRAAPNLEKQDRPD